MEGIIVLAAWIAIGVAAARVWGRGRFVRSLLLLFLILALPFPFLVLGVACWIWRQRLGPIEFRLPRMRPARGRARPAWSTSGVVEYEPWRR